MVVLLPLPKTCSLDLLDEVVRERSGGPNAEFFSQIAVEWRARVEDYVAQQGSPEHISQWAIASERSATFLTLYSHPADGSSQGEMLEQLRDHPYTICPSCGEAGRPNTLDHYLPKQKYPHFAVTPANLFPMCDACQGGKLAKTGDAQSPRYFIHPYFDKFSQAQVIALAIDPPFDAPHFRFGANAALQVDELALLSSHIRHLKIADRYIRYFREQYPRLLRLVFEMRATNQNVRATLSAFKLREAMVSVNSWDHVFYAAVLGNDALMHYLELETLPDYL